MVFLLLGGLLAGFGTLLRRRAADAGEAADADAVHAAAAAPEQRELSWDDVPMVDMLGLELGYRLIPLVDQEAGGALMARIKGVRRKLSQELGFLLHPVHIRDNLELPPTGYRISVLGVPVADAEVRADRELAINPGRVYGTVRGDATRDPAFGLDAVWIDAADREQAVTMGYTVVDAATVIATHLSRVLKEHAHELLGHEEVQKLLDVLAVSHPKLVESLVPKTLELPALLTVLRNLLAEEVPIRDMRTIAETLAQNGARSQDPDALTAAVRVALGRSIVRDVAGNLPELPLIALDPGLEQILLNTVGGASVDPSGETRTLEPGLADSLQRSVRERRGPTGADGRSVGARGVSGHPAVAVALAAQHGQGAARAVLHGDSRQPPGAGDRHRRTRPVTCRARRGEPTDRRGMTT